MDTIVLSDSLGNILHSIVPPAATPSDVVNVNWALIGGSDYFLLQTATDNGFYTPFGSALPSNSDISITLSGIFDSSIALAASNSRGWGLNEYWADFNDITTSGADVAAVPEPATLALFGAGLAGLGALRRRRKVKATA